MGDGIAPKDCNNKVQLCKDNTPLHVQSKKFYYEGMFHLNTSAIENCSKILENELKTHRRGLLQIRESDSQFPLMDTVIFSN